MYVPFDDISADARIWVYQANKKFTTEEVKTIDSKVKDFLESWAAHGRDLASAARVFHHRFLVIAVDEQFNGASGCSIDAQVDFIRSLGPVVNADFFDRTKVAFVASDHLPVPGELQNLLHAGSRALFIEPLANIRQKVAEGKISEDTLTFNNLISHKKDLDRHWLIPAGQSWLSRYFNKKA